MYHFYNYFVCIKTIMYKIALNSAFFYLLLGEQTSGMGDLRFSPETQQCRWRGSVHFFLNWATVFLLSQIVWCPLRSLHCSLTLEPLPEKTLPQKEYWSGAFLGLGQIPSKNVIQPYSPIIFQMKSTKYRFAFLHKTTLL